MFVYPTIALEFFGRQTFFYAKPFRDIDYYYILLIIICKGTRTINKIKNCDFLHIGTWGDIPLVEHQKQHELLENNNHYWLGFDTTQLFGNYSGRDGKRV